MNLQRPDQAPPQTATDSPILVAGHSHMCALVDDFHTPEPELRPVYDLPNVFALHGRWPRQEDYWAHLEANSAGRRIVLVWGGNEHNAFHFFQSDRPFDFVSRHVNKLISSFSVIPQRRVRQDFKTSSIDQLRAVLASLVTRSPDGISVVGTPPPKKDSEKLRQLLLNEPVFVDWAQKKGASLETVKITPPDVRLKLWFLLQEMLAEAAHEVRGKFIPVSAELQDDEGFLRAEYWAQDISHANHLYGETMLRRVLKEIG